MIIADTSTGELREWREIDQALASRAPFNEWLRRGVRYLETSLVDAVRARDNIDLFEQHIAVDLITDGPRDDSGRRCGIARHRRQ